MSRIILRLPAIAVLFALLTLLGSSTALRTAASAPGPKVSMAVSVGWDNHYRPSPAWAPIRVKLHNHARSLVDGDLSAPDNSALDLWQSPLDFHTLYSAHVVLPAGATKTVTLYMPGSDVQPNLTVTLASNGRVIAAQTIYPVRFGARDITVGALSSDPLNVGWLQGLSVRHATLKVANLDPASVVPEADALASFDVIVISDVDSSQLDANQLQALQQYVGDGGAVILVGGPEAERTLRFIPKALLPGPLKGTVPAKNLDGLASLASSIPPARATTIASVQARTGAVLAQQNGIPLIVKKGVGEGQVEYLAFDPAVQPVAGWASTNRFLSLLLAGANPLAMARLSLPLDASSASFLNPGGGTLDMGTLLADTPRAALPSALLLAGICSVYALLVCLGAVVLLRRRTSLRLVWLGLPALAILASLAAPLSVSKARETAQVSTFSVLPLTGSRGSQPLISYSGTFAPVAGSYQLLYGKNGLPAPVASYGSFQGKPNPAHPISQGLRLTEGGQTAADLSSLPIWGTRGISLRTMAQSSPIAGKLRIDKQGNLVGRLRNDTRLTLLEPVIVAGESIVRPKTMPPGTITMIKIQPEQSVGDERSPLGRAYGSSFVGAPRASSRLGPLTLPGWQDPSLPGYFYDPRSGTCCPPPDPPPLNDLREEMRAALHALPEARVAGRRSEVVLYAWTRDSVLPVRAAGSGLRQRALTLVTQPIPVRFGRGVFALLKGTVSARAIDVVPAHPTYSCCGNTIDPIALGLGGSAIFEVDIPPTKRLHFKQLTLSLYAGGSDPSASGYTDVPAGAGSVYDWTRRRWQTLSFHQRQAPLPQPDRFISATGAMLVRLASIHKDTDLTIQDPKRDIQISGSGMVG